MGHQGDEFALQGVEFLFLLQRLGQLFGLVLHFGRALRHLLLQMITVGAQLKVLLLQFPPGVAQLLDALPQRPFLRRQRGLCALALEHPSEQRPDVDQNLQQRFIGLQGPGAEELEHRHHLAADEYRHGDAGPETGLTRRRRPEEVLVRGHILDPRGFSVGEHPTQQTDAPMEFDVLGDLPEPGETAGLLQVPEFA